MHSLYFYQKTNLNYIYDHFPDFNSKQKHQLESLFNIYKDWNSRINVISRKDIDYFYLHHVLHSLSIAKFITFKAGSKIMDLGSGGGFPGVPLAIMFPQVNFHLVDSIGKKIKFINAVKEELGLHNIIVHHERVEKLEIKVDFITSRAVAPLETLINWSGDKISIYQNHPLRNGFLCLKGGDLREELTGFENAIIHPLKEYFVESFFETKKLVFYPLN